MNEENKFVKILPVYTEKYKNHTLQNIKIFWFEPWSSNTLVRLIDMHNTSLKVAVQRLDYYGPPLIQD